MRKDGKLPVRGVFDLEARREPRAFAADAENVYGDSIETSLQSNI
jgi:hypothetical protein